MNTNEDMNRIRMQNSEKRAPLISPGELFFEFLKFGLFTFGGGFSIVAQIQRRFCEEKQLLSPELLLDITSVGRSMPGIMIANVAVMFGYHMAGLPGSVCCLTGMTIPPFTILWVIAKFYAVFRTNPVAAAALYGIRAAVVPILLSAVMGMAKGAYRYPPCIPVSVLAFALYFFFQVSGIWLVVVGVILGFLITGFYEKTGEGTG